MCVRHFKNVHKSSDVIAECHYYVNKKKNAPSAGIFQLIPCTTPSSSPLIHISSAWTLWIRRVYSKNVSISFMLIRQGKIENTAGNSLSCVCDDNDNDDDSEHKNKKRISSKCLWCKKRWRWQKKARVRERGREEENMILLYNFWVYSFSIDLIHIRFCMLPFAYVIRIVFFF